MRLLLASCAVATALTLGACRDAEFAAPSPPRVLTTITVALNSPTLELGRSTIATASGRDQQGESIATGPLTWTSTPNVTVDQNGVVTAVAAGSAIVSASADGRSGQATLKVTALPAVGLAIAVVPSVPVPSGASFAIQPAVRLVDATSGLVAQAGVVVTATVSSGTLVGGTTTTTDANGVATFAALGLAGAAGTHVLTFSAPGMTSAASSVSVVAGVAARVVAQTGNQQSANSGSAVPIAPSVLVTDADGNPVSGVAMAFDVTAGAGAVTGSTTTTNANGIATVGSWILGAPGLNTLRARVVDGTANATFSATALQLPILTTLTVTLSSNTAEVGRTIQATASGTDQSGASIATGNVTWSSTNANASVSSTGLVTAMAAGPVSIVATAGQKSGQSVLTVTAPLVLATLSVSVSPTTIKVGGTSQATLSALDQYGAPIATGPPSWSASGAASISQAGLVTGVSVGQGVVTATVDGRSAQVQVAVTANPLTPVLTTIDVFIPVATLKVGETTTATASGQDQFGQLFALPSVTWSAVGGASVSQQGVVTARSPGFATISASVGALSGQASIAVQPAAAAPPVLTSIVVSTPTSVVQVGSVMQASATAYDQYGAIYGPSVEFQWRSTGGATISQYGLITGTAPGPTTITAIAANMGSITGNTTVTVTPKTGTGSTPILTRLDVVFSPNPIISGETSQASVQGYDQFGAPIATGPVTYSINPQDNRSINPAIISASGLFTPHTPWGGNYRIIATAGNVPGQATVTVRYPTKLTVNAAKSTILVGQSTTVSLEILDQFNNPLDYPAGFPFSSCPGGGPAAGTVVKTSPTTGTVTGTRAGSIYVWAYVPGDAGYYLSTCKVITVTPP